MSGSRIITKSRKRITAKAGKALPRGDGRSEAGPSGRRNKGKQKMEKREREDMIQNVLADISSEEDVYSSEEEDAEQERIEGRRSEEWDRVPGTIPNRPSSSHVADITRRKIINGEYVKMVKLLPTLEDDESEKQDKKEDKKLTFYSWIKCYRVYMSIRLQAFPKEVQGMLRHSEIVQELQDQGRDGMLYDAYFRRYKEQFPEIKWGEYIAAVVNRLPWPQTRSWSNFNNFRRQRSQPRNSEVFCVYFNTMRGCSKIDCRFAHRCRKCGRGGHPEARCYVKPMTRTNQQSNTSNNSNATNISSTSNLRG